MKSLKMVASKMGENKLVYSTQVGRISTNDTPTAKIQGDGVVRIRRETKGRKGKGMTTVSGLALDEKSLKSLCSRLKKMCGTGGAVKDGVLEIQGDNRDKIKATLEQLGHTVKLAGG